MLMRYATTVERHGVEYDIETEAEVEYDDSYPGHDGQYNVGEISIVDDGGCQFLEMTKTEEGRISDSLADAFREVERVQADLRRQEIDAAVDRDNDARRDRYREDRRDRLKTAAYVALFAALLTFAPGCM